MTYHYLTKTRMAHPEVPRDVPMCAKCGEQNDRSDRGYCKRCHAAYMRDWRSRHRYVSREISDHVEKSEV